MSALLVEAGIHRVSKEMRNYTEYILTSKNSRFILEETSVSSIRHSTFTGISVELVLMTFFKRSQLFIKRARAFLFDMTFNLYFSWISLARWLKIHMSKSRPPRHGSQAVERTCILPSLKATTATWRLEFPRLTKATFLGGWSTAGKSFLVRP